MKIYTVTFLIDNYGSILQAYALQCRLKEFGAEPIIIEPTSNLCHSKIYYSFRTLMRVLKPVRHYSLMQRIQKQLHVKKYSVKNDKLKLFRDEYLSVLKIPDKIHFLNQVHEKDVFMAGSDQIWSMAMSSTLSPWYTLQWTKEVPNKKYSYAASIGLSRLTADQMHGYSIALALFDTISLRESQAVDLLASVFPQKVRQDLDPTLLYDSSFWRELKAGRLINEPYIFVYMLRPDNNVIRLARRIAKEKQCKIIYTGLLADNYKGVNTVCDAGIAEFLSYIDNAEVVITNSFHGTAFSVLFESPFLSVKVESTSSRVESFLGMTGLMSQYVSDVNNPYSLNVDFTDALQILERKRVVSLEYLKSICSLEG